MLTGNGWYIWKIKDCEGGNVNAIAAKAKACNITHIEIKVCNGTGIYNINPLTRADLVPALVTALRAHGISVWGWGYVYGNDPNGEAAIATRRVNELGLDGFIVDAESEYKQVGKAAAAVTYMTKLRAGVKVPIALSSYRWPSYHPEFPWEAFREKCDLDMPQVYWAGAANSAAQLERCVREFSGFAKKLPLLPTGAAYHENGWQPTAAQITAFGAKAKELGLPGVNWWEWGNACRYGLFDAACKAWPNEAEPTDHDVLMSLAAWAKWQGWEGVK